MEKITIAPNLIQYQFPPFEGQRIGYNIYALIEGKKALLIDTAFADMAKAVRDDLNKLGIEVDAIVFSHFHPDHTSGLPELGAPKLYGSKHYQQSVDRYTPEEDRFRFDNVQPLDDEDCLTFGSFNLKFKLIDGHVVCGMFTIINDQFVHVADDIMTTNDGKPILPSVHNSNAFKHIYSLELLKKFSTKTLLLSHGNALTGSELIEKDIVERQKYLGAVANNDQEISIEVALEQCEIEFEHKDFHDYVYL